jgi:hypothetical protein
LKSFLSVVILLVFSLIGVGQKISPAKLPYITNYPVYIDGGCSFFNEINTPLQRDKYQLIISAYKVAFIQIRASKYILFKRLKRVKSNGGYIDYYKGREGAFTLASIL